MKLPNYPQKGQLITVEWAQSLINYLRSITPRPSGIDFDWTSDGIIYRAPRIPSYSAISSALVWPGKIYDNSSNGVTQVRCNSGDGAILVVGGQVATINGTPLPVTPTDPSTIPLLAINGPGVVYAKATLDGTAAATVTALAVKFADTLPTPDTSTPPKFGCIPLAMVTIIGSGDTASVAVATTTVNGYGQLQLCPTTGQILWGV